MSTILNWIQNFLIGRTHLKVITVIQARYYRCTTRQLNRPIHTDEDHDYSTAGRFNALMHWIKLWLMSFNPSKCARLKISHSCSPSATNYYIDYHEIEQTSQALYMYLGLTNDNHLKWTNHDHICRIVAKANSTNGFLKRNLISCNSTVKKNYYLTTVHPILEYACTAWSP